MIGDDVTAQHELEAPPTSQPAVILYRNYRGETARRRIIPQLVWFGATDWHPKPQWVLEAFDVDKNATRSFALRDVVSFDYDAEGADVPS